MGPYVANVFDPRSWGHTTEITLEVMRVVLATGLFAIGVELPQSYMAQHAKGLVVMVVPTMAFGWIIVAGTSRLHCHDSILTLLLILIFYLLAIVHALFPNLSFISSLVVAACLTPTDPIICAAIVGTSTGFLFWTVSSYAFPKGGKFALKHVPVNLRRILSAESAANDGLAYPFLSISLYLTLESSRRAAVGKWFLIGWLCGCHCPYSLQPSECIPHRRSHTWGCSRCSIRYIFCN